MWLRTVKRYTVFHWLLIIAFLCLAAYLIFPGFFDPLSSALWPDAIGKHARLSYTVSGSTTYPGIVNLNITVTNNDIIAHNYGIVVLIGSNDHSVWWGPDFYRDNLPPCMDVQNASSQWWIQASICTGSLGLGKSFQVARRIEIANDSRVRDALVIVFDVQNGSHELVRLMKRDVIHVR